MKKNFLLSIIFSILFTDNLIYADELDNNYDDKNELTNVDQSIFNEENENCDDDIVNLFQFSIDAIQQTLSYNIEVLDLINKFVLLTFQKQSGFNINNYFGQYIGSKKFQFLNFKDLQNYKQNFEFIDCFVDINKINHISQNDLTKSNSIFFFIKSLIYEYLSVNKIKNYHFSSRSVFNGELIKRVFTNQKYKQRLNKFIKDHLGIKKNLDFCQYLHFVVLEYKNTFSSESLDGLFKKYNFIENKNNFKDYESIFSKFIKDLRHLDEDNEEFQSSLDIVSQNIINDPKLLKIFLLALIDKLSCCVKNTEINQNVEFFVYNYSKN